MASLRNRNPNLKEFTHSMTRYFHPKSYMCTVIAAESVKFCASVVAVVCVPQVLAQPDAEQQGFDASIFINPDTLHLTLLMLKLYSDEARHKAAQALQSMQPQVCACEPLTAIAVSYCDFNCKGVDRQCMCVDRGVACVCQGAHHA